MGGLVELVESELSLVMTTELALDRVEGDCGGQGDHRHQRELCLHQFHELKACQHQCQLCGHSHRELGFHQFQKPKVCQHQGQLCGHHHRELGFHQFQKPKVCQHLGLLELVEA